MPIQLPRAKKYSIRLLKYSREKDRWRVQTLLYAYEAERRGRIGLWELSCAASSSGYSEWRPIGVASTFDAVWDMANAHHKRAVVKEFLA